MNRVCCLLGLVFLAILTGCGPDDTAMPAAATTTKETTSTGTPEDIRDIADFERLDVGTYYIDPDGDSSTPLRVLYRVAADGWSQWIGAVKFPEVAEGHVSVSIATVTNLVRHGCRDHSRANPPVGPTVDDLASALADLVPFRVTSPPTDVTMYGYAGKHLELTVPDRWEADGDESFAGCAGEKLKSWIAPTVGAFYGHGGAGYSQEFWILDVEGTRLVVMAGKTRDSPAKDVVEMEAILDSIQIEP